ncbi:MAG: tetratricopeptide repeat protein [candidate division KSB1 bacterium]|nr:tetratricopeptide repeat protein [candidate division KSB1 bacterium]MDZ7304844.1 tetratricopeptide repeat protein [candidate division KSB1 bacterium]MDZ7313924.1 tetratricopeptide repeat protein [candidate division KSB1 bacterium]
MTRKLLLPIFLLSGIMMVGCSKKMSEEQLFTKAREFESKDDLDGALKVYEELSDRFPKSPRADSVLQKLGVIYLNKKEQYEKAVAVYKRLIDKYPQSKYQPQSLFMIGYIYANHLKDFDKAKNYYNQFLEKYPQHELTTSVQWELQHLGQDISEIDIFSNAASGQETAGETSAPVKEAAQSEPKAKP